MFGSSCGTELPDDASFCLKCGRPQAGNVAVPTRTDDSPTQWEIAEITYYDIGRIFNKAKFVVHCIGPGGKWQIAECHKSSGGLPLPHQPEKGHVRAVDALRAHLLREGREETEKGEDWYEYRYRRRYDGRTAHPCAVITF